MQTIEEYKEYTKQLEDEVKQWHDAFDASQVQVKELTKENLRLERERVEQNSIIETCANELEELRLHEVEWDLAKARIKVIENMATEIAKLKEAQRWRKCSEELPEDGAEVLATDGEEIWLCHKDTMCDDSPWFQPDGLPHIEGVTHWKPLPSAPKEE
jgi:predicted RNase H-like nuclease (RuvC/YqgF family)